MLLTVPRKQYGKVHEMRCALLKVYTVILNHVSTQGFDYTVHAYVSCCYKCKFLKLLSFNLYTFQQEVCEVMQCSRNYCGHSTLITNFKQKCHIFKFHLMLESTVYLYTSPLHHSGPLHSHCINVINVIWIYIWQVSASVFNMKGKPRKFKNLLTFKGSSTFQHK